MKISEMEAQLKELRGKHGDLPVFMKTIGKDDFNVVKNIEQNNVYSGPFSEIETKCITLLADDEY